MREEKIECEAHGPSAPAFVCGHLCDGEALGFHYEAERVDDEMCPDAWCDDCHAALEAAGEWTDDLEQQADIKVVCSLCYGEIRAKNWVQDEEAWAELVDSAIDYLNAQQEVLRRDFKIGDHDRYDYDQSRAELVFSAGGKVVLVCDVAFVGGVSTRSDTWMWSWANSTNEEPVKAAMREVRDFGEERGFERLAGAYWGADPEDGWQMTAVAAKYLGAMGAYRCPTDYGFLYMVITGARWAH